MAARTLDLLVVWLFLGLAWVFFGGFMDYPCTVRYNAAAKCLDVLAHRDLASLPTTAVLLTSTEAGFSGGSCKTAGADQGSFHLQTNTFDELLERRGDRLLVNGRPLAPGEDFHRVNPATWNPWTTYDLRFHEEGIGTACRQPESSQRMWITGVTGTSFSPLKGLLILAVVIPARIKVRRRMKSLGAAVSPAAGSEGP